MRKITPIKAFFLDVTKYTACKLMQITGTKYIKNKLKRKTCARCCGSLKKVFGFSKIENLNRLEYEWSVIEPKSEM